MKLGEKEIEFKVTARSIDLYERETKTTIQELLNDAANGAIPSMFKIVSMIKHATSLKEDECYKILSENDFVLSEIMKLYTELFAKIYNVAKSGNLESPAITE